MALNASQETKEVALTPFLQLVPTNETGFCAYYPVFENYPTDSNTLSGAISGCIVSGPTIERALSGLTDDLRSIKVEDENGHPWL